MKRSNSHSFWAIMVAYAIASVALLLYSYTQVDLSLTLSRASFVQTVQKTFQYIGFFNRPISMLIFVAIISAFFGLYSYVLITAGKKNITVAQIWKIIFMIVIILLISYPAFSYDFFNYLFTAKTILVYHKNPYMVVPLQFSGIDPWLSFLHWTHLPSAYTPLWIAVTIPAYLFGFGYLLTLMWSLKFVMALAYLAAIKGIELILNHDNKEHVARGIIIFALNPLVIIESLVSPHNDILMMALAVWAIVLYQRKQIWLSWFILSLSIAMKLMTISLIPSFFMKWNRKMILFSMLAAIVAVMMQREILSWYWLWAMPFVALVPEIRAITIISGGISIGLLLRYAPFLYMGHWDNPVPMIKFWVTIIPIITSLVIVLIRFVWRRSSYIIRA